MTDILCVKYGDEDATQKINTLTHYGTQALSLKILCVHVYMYMYRHIYMYVLLPKSRTARAF